MTTQAMTVGERLLALEGRVAQLEELLLRTPGAAAAEEAARRGGRKRADERSDAAAATGDVATPATAMAAVEEVRA